MNEKPKIKEQFNIADTILLILKGAVIGIGGILPGLSGGVLCVIFGLYKPIIEFLADPLKNMWKNLGLLIPVGIGVGVGFIGFAGLVNAFMTASPTAAICVFAGLIIGMIPDLWKDAGAQGRDKVSLGAMAASLIFFLILLTYLQHGIGLTITPNFGWYIFCGVAWGLSIIVPGLSSSSMLIFFGLYQPMLAGMSSFDMGVLIPLAIGGCGVVFTLSKAMNYFFQHHYALANHIIVGIVIATTVMIIPLDFATAGEAASAVISIVAGILAAKGLNTIFAKIAKDKAQE